MPGQYAPDNRPNTLFAIILSAVHALRPSPLAERFKYAVISSSLLSEDISSPGGTASPVAIIPRTTLQSRRSLPMYGALLILVVIIAWWRPAGWMLLILAGFGTLEVWYRTQLALESRAAPVRALGPRQSCILPIYTKSGNKITIGIIKPDTGSVHMGCCHVICVDFPGRDSISGTITFNLFCYTSIRDAQHYSPSVINTVDASRRGRTVDRHVRPA